jgi:NADP-dependent 3-hydroxy acid dehydrogenase YdfG
VRLVPLLRVGQRQQNVPLLAGPPLRQLTVTSGLRALVGEVLPPTTDLTAARGSRHTHIMATASLTHTSLIGRRRGSFAGPQSVCVYRDSAVRLGDDAFEHRDVDLVQVLDVQTSPRVLLVIKAPRRYNISNTTEEDWTVTESSTGASTGRLLGKSALVTGAAAGIGRATAMLFAREGARLVVADINSGGLATLGDSLANVTDDVAVVTADVSKPEDVRRMIDVAVDQYGRLDIAVANAGIIPLASVVEATLDDWEEVMAIDGRGMFLTCKYAIEQMLINGGGSIVCLSSISGMAGQARQSTYGPAKFVASGLTKHLAIEWAS